MLNSAHHEIYPAHKILKYIYKQDKYYISEFKSNKSAF